MNWLRENWFWVLLIGLFLWMHFKMHGGHGARGGHGADRGREADGGHGGHGGGGCCGGASDDQADGHDHAEPSAPEKESHAQH